MKDLKDYSIEDLQKEINRREKLSSVPELIENPDFSNAIREAEEIINSVLVNDGRPGKDYKNGIFSEIMKALYGPSFFLNGGTVM